MIRGPLGTCMSTPLSTGLLLAPDEPAPVSIENRGARSEYVIVCDHASNRLPRALGDLGLSEDDLVAHIAWDIGAAAVARLLVAELDATLFLQQYSRLVIDCNRPLHAPDAIPEKTGGVAVPGNMGLAPADAQARAQAIFHPYHQEIRHALDLREAEHRPTVLVAMHSFTPVLYGVARPFHAGVLYHKDSRLGRPLIELLRAEPGLLVGDNEPYAASDVSDYSIIEHAERRGNPYVELEVRQDLIAAAPGQREWAARLARCIVAAKNS